MAGSSVRRPAGRDAADGRAGPALNHALIKNYSIVGLHWGLYATKEPKAIRDGHDQLLKLAAAGAIKPLVSERLGLAGVIDGLEGCRGHHYRAAYLPALRAG